MIENFQRPSKEEYFKEIVEVVAKRSTVRTLKLVLSS